MTTIHTFQTAFTATLGKPIAFPANTKTMVFFGTGGDGNQANRTPGGPALTISSGVPVYGADYASLGSQPVVSPTRFDVIDTAVANDSTNFPLGLTWACVARNPGGSVSTAMSNMTAASGQGVNMDVLSLQSVQNRVLNYSGLGARGTIQLNNSVTTTWHFIALTDTGGAAPTVQVYEFTEVPAGQVGNTPYSPTGRTANAAMTAHFGNLSVEFVNTLGPIDIAWGFVATGVMTQPNLAALAASIRPWLARRGIVM